MIAVIEGLEKSYSEKTLLHNVQLSLAEGEKVGVIGQNGCGKSTLLKILAGVEKPDHGSVVFGNHVVISYLPQDPDFADGQTVLQAVLESGKARGEETWDLEGRAKSILTRLGLPEYDRLCSVLSGGQKKRVALAAAILAPADLLILDEPTNHLDSEMVEWLEQYLKSWRGALIMVTHDRYFLDSVTGRIVEIFRGEAFSYETGYEGFLEKKMERMQLEQSAEQKRQNLLRKELAWVRRGAQARSTKQKARLERFEELNARKAPEQEGTVSMSAASARMGRTTIELHDVCKGYGDRELIRNFTYIFRKWDRVGFIGENGCGKTTLMRILAGEEQPDSGNIEVGQTIQIGYYSQLLSTDPADGIRYMDPEKRVIDYIRDTAEYVRTDEGLISASKMLERFLFSGDQQYGRIGKLSGGEKRRLNLLRVLMQAPNVLILDEPTNDLDLTTLTVLEDYLDRFDGIVIAVSHDRYFLDRVVSRIFAFEEGGKLRQYEGGYTDYYRKKQEESSLATESEKRSGARGKERGAGAGNEKEKPRRTRLKFTWQEAKEYETIESEIEALEQEAGQLEQDMSDAGSNYVRLNELQKKKEETARKLDEKMERWSYLEELAERIREQDS